jgi:hypothetical protein
MIESYIKQMLDIFTIAPDNVREIPRFTNINLHCEVTEIITIDPPPWGEHTKVAPDGME